VAFYSNRVLSQIDDLIGATARRPVVVGIDGQGGSGKSTLAAECVARTGPGVIVEGDDFYRDMAAAERAALDAAGGYERYFDWERLRAQVLVPVRAGEGVLRYQRYDWVRGRQGGWVEVPVPEVVVVEGVYTLRPQLLELLDVKIYVRAGEDTRMDRQIARGQDSSEWITRWVAAEDFYVAAYQPWRNADLVIDGEPRGSLSCQGDASG
jgi:phosphoribulokinase